MKVWLYKEEKEKHLLVKFYKENHGEGEFIGDLDEASIKALIVKYKPNANVEQAYGILDYFGMLPLLVIK